jgi:Tfp pilus assembly protein PilF
MNARGGVSMQQIFDRALALYQAGHLTEAEQLCLQILRAHKRHFGALHLLGVIRHQQGRNDEALDALSAALKAQSNSASARANRGLVLMALGRHKEALADFDRALAIQPDCVEALTNRGNALHGLDRLEDAVASFDRALALQPAHVDAHYNRGIALHGLNRHAEAVTSYQRALALRPDYADAHWNEALTRLALGDFAEGWKKFESRWWTSDCKTSGLKFPQPLWRGEPIDGRSILIYAEQGLGDTIQFVRYVPMVAERGAKVVLAVHSELKELLASAAGAAAVFGENEPLPGTAFQCPLLSLPLAFGTTAETIPAKVPYLSANDAAVARWRERLPQTAALRVGLVWSGNPSFNQDRRRSPQLSRVLPLLATPGVVFYSLNPGIGASDVAALAAHRNVIHLGPQFRNFSDTAAVISLVDLVITSDTAVAHLAGAMGRPVWIMLHDAPDWRWALDRERSSWYPSARLFRQEEAGDWAGVVARMQNELTALSIRVGQRAQSVDRNALDHDPIRLHRDPGLAVCLSMILSENVLPLVEAML